jgi:hypothetical protein
MCKESKRQTINADDVLKALDEMDFPEFVEPLRTSLQGQHCYLRHVNHLLKCSMGLSICKCSKRASVFTSFHVCFSFIVLSSPLRPHCKINFVTFILLITLLDAPWGYAYAKAVRRHLFLLVFIPT